MKKILALLLIIAIIVGCCTISVSAENSKILPDLQTVIEKSNPDDIVKVYIAFKGRMKCKDEMPSWPDLDKAAEEYKDYIDERNKKYLLRFLTALK